ncbi:MAG: hypothetical protein NVSMB3_05790 [Acidobacteriaceae bacterium]
MTRETIARVNALHGIEPGPRSNVLHELRVKEAQFSQALVLALGLSMRAEVAATSVEPGKSATVHVEVESSSGEAVMVRASYLTAFVSTEVGRSAETRAAAGEGSVPVGKSQPYRKDLTYAFAEGTPGTRPYFSRSDMEKPFYEVGEARLRNAPLAPAALTAHVEMEYGGVLIEMVRVAGLTGEKVYQPLQVVPAVSVSVTPGAGVVPEGERSFRVETQLRDGSAPSSEGAVTLEAPKGWKVVPGSASWKPTGTAEARSVPFTVEPGRIEPQTSYRLSAVARYGGKEYREGFAEVGYPGLVRDHLYSPATYRARGVEVKVPPGLRVAYLPGTGDAVEASLGDIGIHATRLTVAEIASGKLGSFDALILGVRAYAAQKELPKVTAKLMEFANGGGVVVVQYQSGEFVGEDAPYPLSLGGGIAERVVEEDAPVRLETPASQVLSWPNKITEKDFNGWVEERGHGFLREWDGRYEAVTEVHDAGQDPQKGGLLVAKIGKGAYVYCAYALYRQMPEGVPGAFRLMANMVSLGKRP